MESSLLKQKTLGLFVKTGGVLSRPFFAGKGFFICLHRVLPKTMHDKFWKEAGMAVSPEYLQWLINFIRKHGFELVSLDEAMYRLTSNNTKPFAAITLDDGWYDNLMYGLPVFEKNQAPFTVYVTNCFPEGTALSWAEKLTEVVAENNEVNYRDKDKNYNYKTASHTAKVNAYHAVRHFILEAKTKEEMLSRVNVVFDAYSKPQQSEALSWNEVRTLAAHPLCVIGAHTQNHLPLAKLSEADALAEMENSKKAIQQKIGKEVKHFAYPFGSKNECSVREFQLAAKAGYTSAVTGRPSNVFLGNLNYPMAIPRYAIGETTGKERLEYIMNGILHFSFNGFKRIVTD